MVDFRESWIDEQVHRIQMLYPNDYEDDIRKFVEQEFDDNFKDPKCIMYNNYEKETVNTSLSKVTNWIREKKPITTESGTLFKQHADCWNPDTQILENKLSERKVAKGKMFQYKELSKQEIDKIKKAELLYMSAKYNMVQKSGYLHILRIPYPKPALLLIPADNNLYCSIHIFRRVQTLTRYCINF